MTLGSDSSPAHGPGDSTSVRRRDSVLRILTDLLILDDDTRGAADRTSQEELMLSLIGEASIVMRREIAERISAHPNPPARLVAALARDDFSVAAPVLRHCTLITDSDCAEIVLTTSLDHARTIAGTHKPGPQTIEAILALEDQAAIAALLRNTEVTLPEDALTRLHRLAIDHGGLAHSLMSRPGLTPPMLADLFWFAGSEKRREILEQLAPLVSSPGWRRPTRELVSPLRLAGAEGRESACEGMSKLLRGGQIDAFTGVFARALGIDETFAARITGDELGEPFQVACRAGDIPIAHFTGYLIHYNPVVGRSIERVFALQRAYEQVPLQLAWRLLEDWNATQRGERQAPYSKAPAREPAREAYAVRTGRSEQTYAAGRPQQPARPATQTPERERTGS